MTGDEPVECGRECRAVKPAGKMQCGRQVVGLTGGRIELGEEPQPLLGKRQRQGLSAVGHGQGERRIVRGGRDGGGQIAQRRVGKQCRQCDVHAGLVHAVQQLHRQQRVTAEGKELIVTTDTIQPEQLLPKRGQRGFDPALRRFIVAGGKGSLIRGREGLAVELAVRGERQGVKRDKG
ncbi:hypothetical protein PB72LOC_03354 [Pectobacterium atrosepticum]|nr:hypothetical protein PB72LOC_03354 [Pectobacterium atrosepticum]